MIYYRLHLFVSIQALDIYLRHDGRAEITRGGHRRAVQIIEEMAGYEMPRNTAGHKHRREVVALMNALIMYAILEGEEHPVRERWSDEDLHARLAPGQEIPLVEAVGA